MPSRCSFALILAGLLGPAPGWAAAAASADPASGGRDAPYVVKKGDTLWGIADHFFKDPHQWIKLWERNLYITNPDLIYPGNTIRLDLPGRGARKVVRLRPEIRSKPVERLEGEVDAALLLTALARQDFIAPDATQGVGYILDSVDERIHYGANDRLYVRLDVHADAGDTFDVFRRGDPVRDPKTGRLVGVLVHHLGRLRITGRGEGNIYRAIVLEAFEELARGDRLKPARSIDPRIRPSFPTREVAGEILYIRAGAAEAGQGQVVGISLGRKDGMRPGMLLSVHRAGRMITDSVTGARVRLPEETIGELMVLAPQADASIALVRRSRAPINLGDAVRGRARR